MLHDMQNAFGGLSYILLIAPVALVAFLVSLYVFAEWMYRNNQIDKKTAESLSISATKKIKYVALVVAISLSILILLRFLH